MDDAEMIRRVVDEQGDEAGWDEATRRREVIRRTGLMRDSMPHLPAVISFIPFKRARSMMEQIDLDPGRPIHGATMRDEFGDTEYNVVLGEGGALVFYGVRAIHGTLGEVSDWGEQPREWPRDLVVRLVTRYLAGELASPDRADTIPRNEAWDEALGRARQPRNEYVGQIIRDAISLGASPHQALKSRSGKSSATVDRWLREARAADPTLPQARRNPGITNGTTKGMGQK